MQCSEAVNVPRAKSKSRAESLNVAVGTVAEQSIMHRDEQDVACECSEVEAECGCRM